MLRVASILALALSATPALAKSCIVDYETFEVRSILPTDHATIAAEQSLTSYDWGIETNVTVAGDTYMKYGLPRILYGDEIGFYGFKDSVPFLRDIASSDTPPELLYAPVSVDDCEFQAYQLTPR
jgi:hypothetical protein